MLAIKIRTLTFLILSFPVMHIFGQIYSENMDSDVILKEEVAKYDFVFDALHELHLLEKEIQSHTDENYRNHFMGDAVAVRMHVFQQRYTYHSEAAPGAFSGQKVVRKPLIYNAIMKIESHLKKQIRKEKISVEQGEFTMNFCLEYATVLLHENTEDLEETLRNLKSVNEIIRVFEGIQLR